MNIWDSDKDIRATTDDMVDEFAYDFTDPPGSIPRVITIESIRKEPKSR